MLVISVLRSEALTFPTSLVRTNRGEEQELQFDRDERCIVSTPLGRFASAQMTQRGAAEHSLDLCPDSPHLKQRPVLLTASLQANLTCPNFQHRKHCTRRAFRRSARVMVQPILTLPLSMTFIAAANGHCSHTEPKPLYIRLIGPGFTSSSSQLPSLAITVLTSSTETESSRPTSLISPFTTGLETVATLPKTSRSLAAKSSAFFDSSGSGISIRSSTVYRVPNTGQLDSQVSQRNSFSSF